MAKKTKEHCSFCGREKPDASLLVSGIEGQICNFCIEQAKLILEEETGREFKAPDVKTSVLKPTEIKSFLDKYVIGQEEAIKKLVKSIQRTRVGLKDPKKPIGTFIFLGMTFVTQ